METETARAQASEVPEDAWTRWRLEHADVLARATAPQRILLEATVRFMVAIASQPILLRVAAFFLLHAGMGLTPAQVGLAVGRTERAMRTVQALGAREILDSIWAELGRHRQPKLRPEHAGSIAKYLVEHPQCTQPDVARFIAAELRIVVDVQTLRRFLDTYGLGVLHPSRRAAEEAEPSRPR